MQLIRLFSNRFFGAFSFANRSPAINRQIAFEAILALIAVKMAIWVVSLASGTSGGVLAPLLMMGAGLGALLAPALPGGDPLIWPLIGVAAVLGGMMRAPITSVLFAFEVTHDTGALLPLLASSAIAYGFTVLVMKRSVPTEKIVRRGHHIYREYAVDPLDRFFVQDSMTRHVVTVDAEASLADVAPVGSVLYAGKPRSAVPAETCRTVSNRLAARHLRSDLVKPSLHHAEEEEHREQLRRLTFRFPTLRVAK